MPVTDALERGISESRQIMAQRMGAAAPRQKRPRIPLGEIQEMLRAGRDPAEVARALDVDEATVLRSARSVEIDRQYRITLFRRTPVPRSTPRRTAEAVVRARLADRGVRFEDARWGAVLPSAGDAWRITLSFSQDGEDVSATWVFDDHGAISSADEVARELLTTDEEIGQRERRAAQKARAVEPAAPVERPAAPEPEPVAEPGPDAAASEGGPAAGGPAEPVPPAGPAGGTPAGEGQAEGPRPAATVDEEGVPTADIAISAPAVPDPAVPAGHQADPGAPGPQTTPADPAEAARAGRKPRRPAMPTWDEILLGGPGA